MRTPLAFATLTLLALASVPARAQTADTGRTLITTSGQAHVMVTPDRVVLTLLVEPQAMSVEEASSRVASVQQAVLDTLRRLNIPAGSIQSFNSGVVPYRNQMNPMASGPSFSGRSSIRVETSRLDLVPAISGAALAKGAAFVSPPNFTVSAADSVRRTLLPQAFAQARREAEALAAAAGGRLGRLVSINVTMMGTDFVERAQAMAFSNMMYDNGQRTSPSSTVSVNVTTCWTLVR
jgi:uncharacterized protein YggE